MPITMEKAGARVIVKAITGSDKIRAHLADLGFVVGATITVVSKIEKNVILQVKESRVALDESMASRILV